MNHGEEREIKDEDSYHLVINGAENSISDSPFLETLLLRKGSDGYTVNKGRKIPRPRQNQNSQDCQYISPKIRNESLKPEEFSSLYTKYMQNCPYFTSSLQNVFLPQEQSICQPFGFNLNHLTSCQLKNDSEASTSEDTDQDQAIVNTNDSAEIAMKVETPNAYLEYAAQVLGECSVIKNDCFLGERMSQNLSELDGFQFEGKDITFLENAESSTFAEPMLEKLFSQISDASQASTKTADLEELEFSDPEEDKDEESPKKQRLSALQDNINILEDGSILVINRSDSDVHVLGSV